MSHSLWGSHFPKSSRKLRYILILISVSILWPTLVGAAPNESVEDGRSASLPTIEQARRAFLQGMDLMKREQWAEAHERFAYAASARRTPGLLYYQAYCLEQLGRYVEALEAYLEAQDLIDKVAAADVKALLPEAIQRADAAVSTLAVVGLPDGAELSIDGQLQAKGTTARLNPGSHVVEIVAPGYEKYRAELSLLAGAKRTIEPELVERVESTIVEPDPSEIDSPPAERRGTVTPPAKPYIVGAAATIGAVGLGVGIYFTIERGKASRDYDEVNAEIGALGGTSNSACGNVTAPWAPQCEELSDHLSKKKTAQTMMIVGYTTFGAGAAAAILTQVLWKPVPVELAVLPGGGFVGYRGRFN